ncbi:hypothetical protein AVEN_37104-1 [Araneus ventricosus]|uniref:Uncharacterized protein n=1 Tax=Araneus ventricosus TaxID=182803 RepID=A0A4Y2Q5W5_ARAVE|nr:hypothetical protein AVEN_37104-1 [Araneus ventricosus]
MATFLAPEIKSWRYLLKTFYSQICSLRRYFIVHEAGVESYNVDRPDIDGSSAIDRRCICLPNISEADIRKYLGKESNSQMRSDLNAYRFLLLLAQGQSRIILPRAQIAASTHAHGESDEREKRQAGVGKYRAQKIASSAHARGDGGFVGDAIIQTDRQSTF